MSIAGAGRLAELLPAGATAGTGGRPTARAAMGRGHRGLLPRQPLLRHLSRRHRAADHRQPGALPLPAVAAAPDRRDGPRLRAPLRPAAHGPTTAVEDAHLDRRARLRSLLRRRRRRRRLRLRPWPGVDPHPRHLLVGAHGHRRARHPLPGAQRTVGHPHFGIVLALNLPWLLLPVAVLVRVALAPHPFTRARVASRQPATPPAPCRPSGWWRWRWRRSAARSSSPAGSTPSPCSSGVSRPARSLSR